MLQKASATPCCAGLEKEKKFDSNDACDLRLLILTIVGLVAIDVVPPRYLRADHEHPLQGTQSDAKSFKRTIILPLSSKMPLTIVMFQFPPSRLLERRIPCQPWFKLYICIRHSYKSSFTSSVSSATNGPSRCLKSSTLMSSPDQYSSSMPADFLGGIRTLLIT
jgi:hypothetical protein